LLRTKPQYAFFTVNLPNWPIGAVQFLDKGDLVATLTPQTMHREGALGDKSYIDAKAYGMDSSRAHLSRDLGIQNHSEPLAEPTTCSPCSGRVF
jgi:hypothetical protein